MTLASYVSPVVYSRLSLLSMNSCDSPLLQCGLRFYQLRLCCPTTAPARYGTQALLAGAVLVVNYYCRLDTVNTCATYKRRGCP